MLAHSPSRHPKLCIRLLRQRLRAGTMSVSNAPCARRIFATTGDCDCQDRLHERHGLLPRLPGTWIAFATIGAWRRERAVQCEPTGVPGEFRREIGDLQVFWMGRFEYFDSLLTERVYEFRENRSDFNEWIDSVEIQEDVMMSCSQGECIAMRPELDALRAVNAELDKMLKECYTQAITNSDMANSNYKAISHDFDMLRPELHARIDGLVAADSDEVAIQLDDMARTIQCNVGRLIDALRAETADAAKQNVERSRQLGVSIWSCLAVNRNLDAEMGSLEGILAASLLAELERLVDLMKSPNTEKNGL